MQAPEDQRGSRAGQTRARARRRQARPAGHLELGICLRLVRSCQLLLRLGVLLLPRLQRVLERGDLALRRCPFIGQVQKWRYPVTSLTHPPSRPGDVRRTVGGVALTRTSPPHVPSQRGAVGAQFAGLPRTKICAPAPVGITSPNKKFAVPDQRPHAKGSST